MRKNQIKHGESVGSRSRRITDGSNVKNISYAPVALKILTAKAILAVDSAAYRLCAGRKFIRANNG